MFNSLSRQSIRIKEIILVDDGFTDRTPDIGIKHNARVIRLMDLPRGWIGKSWACYNGARAATGDHLFFRRRYYS